MDNKDVLLGAAVTATVIGGLGIVLETNRHTQEEWEKNHPDILRDGGLIEIIVERNGTPVNFRSTTTIPRPEEQTNLIPLQDINLGGGETAADVDRFFVTDYVLEEGQNPTTNRTDPNNTGTWIAFPDADGTIIRMSLSPNTWGYWKTIAEGKTIKGKLNESGFQATNGETVPKEKIGEISLSKAEAQKKMGILK